MKKFAIPLLVLAIVGLLMGAVVRESRAERSLEPYLHRVVTHRIDIQTRYTVDREYAGIVEARHSSRLGFERAGEIEQLLVDEGDPVEAGQLLAQLDTRLLEAERDELEAQTAELEAELDLAQRNLARIERLTTENLASARERDELRSRTQVLAASLKRVEAVRDSNRIRLQKSRLTAPFAARIARREIDAGTVVAAGQPVFELVETGRREVRAGIPVERADALTPGDVLRVRIGSEILQGEVVALGPLVDQVTRSRAVRVAVPGNWSPGDLAYALVEQDVLQSGAWVPDTAVTEGLRGTWVVYAAVATGDNESVLEARSVVIHHAAAHRLFVSGAVEDGAEIVASGLHRLAPGQRVRSAPESIASAEAGDGSDADTGP